MITASRLDLEAFKQVVQNAPLFAIDLVVLNDQCQILVGQRKNAPAKGYWFVPGGRVFKNESLENAFERISQSELGVKVARNQTAFLGLYDHFYNDSAMDEAISTHYINAAHVLCLKGESLNLPDEQHGQYQWLNVEQMHLNQQVHSYSKIFLTELRQWLKTND